MMRKMKNRKLHLSLHLSLSLSPHHSPFLSLHHSLSLNLLPNLHVHQCTMPIRMRLCKPPDRRH